MMSASTTIQAEVRDTSPTIFERLITVFSLAFLAALTLSTALYTTTTWTYAESPEGYLLNLEPSRFLLALIVIAICITPITRSLLAKFSLRFYLLATFICGTILSIAWVFIADVTILWADPNDILTAAQQFLDDSPNADRWSFRNFNYTSRFPYQMPYILFVAGCLKVFGNNCILALQLLNCLAIGTIMTLAVALTHELASSIEAVGAASFLSITCWPMIAYSTFVYANIIALPFMIGAITLAVHTIKAPISRVKTFVLGLIVSILLVIASILKSTFTIVTIAIAITWFLHAVIRKRPEALLLVAMPFILSAALMMPINSYVESKNIHLGTGLPRTSWLVMGIGGGMEYKADSEANPTLADSLRNPGWYDTYVWRPHSPSEADEMNSYYLKKRLGHYVRDPQLALKFFTKKFLLEWTEPTFESLTSSCYDGDEEKWKLSKRQYTLLGGKLYYGEFNHILIVWGDIWQSLVATFALIFVFSSRRQLSYAEQVPLVLALGACVLFLFWEGKAQYIFPFFFLLIPFAAHGLAKAQNFLASVFEKPHHPSPLGPRNR